MLIKAYTSVHPTENMEKVEKALFQVMSSGKLTVKKINEEMLVSIESNDLDSLNNVYSKIRTKKIVDSFRRELLRNKRGNYTAVMLNKQSAVVGAITICEDLTESPLGPITLEIDADNLDEIINWLAPKTKQKKRLFKERKLVAPPFQEEE